MLSQLFHIITLALITVSIHGLYSAFLLARLHRRRERKHRIRHDLRGYLPILGEVVVLLLLMHFAEATVWAVFYLLAHGLPDLETALYFSLTSYTTIGYGDVLLPPKLRMIGVSEGLVGTFMCGWSVAIVVAILQEIARDSAARPPADGGRGNTAA